MFSRSIRATIQPQLGDGEALLAAVLAQAGGASAQLMAHALSPTGAALRADRATDQAHAHAGAAATDVGLRLDRRMVIAVTSQRLLIFRTSGVFTVKATELIGQAPIEAVEAITVHAQGLIKPVTLHVRGAAIGVETARGQPAEALPEALARARAHVAASHVAT